MNAILAFTITGCKTPCGNTIGSDGSGDYFQLITGTEEQCWDYAKKLLRDVEKTCHIGATSFAIVEGNDKIRFVDLTPIKT